METQTYDELVFAENAEKVTPLLETLTELLSSGRVTLKGQKYRIENNQLTIQGQEKLIADHKVLIEETNRRAAAIISVAEDRAKEVENNMKSRVAEINHRERESVKKMEEADKILYNAKNKKPVGV